MTRRAGAPQSGLRPLTAPQRASTVTITVLVAVHQPGMHQALARLIGGEPGLVLTGQAQDAIEAIAIAEAIRPDVALLEVRMPGGGGAAAARGIRSSSPGTRVVALSVSDDANTIADMLRAGAVGYVVNDGDGPFLTHAIREAASGRWPVSPAALRSLSRAVGALTRPSAKSDRRTGRGLNIGFQATQSLLRAQTEVEIVQVLTRTVETLGGELQPAATADGDAIPLDLSLGTDEPMLAASPDPSIRQQLSTVLPGLVEDAHGMIAILRNTGRFAEAARVDALTGLLNRRAAMKILPRLRPGDVVLMVDVDHFKQVNDTRGHSAGDTVLREFAAILARTVREGDLCSRWGGEEFVVGLDSGGTDGTRSFFDRLRAAWSSGRPLPVTFSAGAAEISSTGALDALESADAALYRAKAEGRDRLVIADRVGDPGDRDA